MNEKLTAAAPELLQTLKDLLARMEENEPKKAKKNDMEAIYRNAIFYRDLHTARRLIATLEE